MAFARGTAVLLSCLAFAPALRAQEYEPATLGIQVRGSVPLGDLKDAVGGFKKPGVGISVVMEEDFLEGYRGRIALGADDWFKGSLDTVSGSRGGVSAYHLTVEGVRLLRPYGDFPIRGPYVLAGLGFYQWTVSTENPAQNTSSTRRMGHAAVSFGFGWRASAHLDAELKVLAGRLDPGLTAAAVLAGVTWRY